MVALLPSPFPFFISSSSCLVLALSGLVGKASPEVPPPSHMRWSSSFLSLGSLKLLLPLSNGLNWVLVMDWTESYSLRWSPSKNIIKSSNKGLGVWRQESGRASSSLFNFIFSLYFHYYNTKKPVFGEVLQFPASSWVFLQAYEFSSKLF